MALCRTLSVLQSFTTSEYADDFASSLLACDSVLCVHECIAFAAPGSSIPCACA